MFLKTKAHWTAVGVILAVGMAGTVSGQSRGWVRPPNAPLPFPTQVRPAEGSARMRQLSNLKTWTLSTIQYLQDTSNHYPDMRSAATAKKALWRYVVANKGGVDPVTQRLYVPNSWLSHKSGTAVSAPSKMAMFYEARPNADGTRAVGFADGHCALILAREWPRVKRESHIP